VPSSTFSSEPRRVPCGRWSAIWLVAIVLAIGATTLLERAVRSRNHRPSIDGDDVVTWSLTRRDTGHARNVVAFVGTSRLALAISPRAFHEAAPSLRPVQLSINGVYAMGVLGDLADDPTFRGIAVVDIIEWDVDVLDAFAGAKPYVERSHALWRAPGALANRYLANIFQSKLAVLAVTGRGFLTLFGGRMPEPRWVTTNLDRWMEGDYSTARPAELARKAAQRESGFASIPTPEGFLNRLATDLEPLVAKIRAHGGDVVVIRMPVSGRLDGWFTRHFPRARYWDAFAARTRAHTIYMPDVLGPLALPDEMHVDVTQQAAFTHALVDAMRARGILDGR